MNQKPSNFLKKQQPVRSPTFWTVVRGIISRAKGPWMHHTGSQRRIFTVKCSDILPVPLIVPWLLRQMLLTCTTVPPVRLVSSSQNSSSKVGLKGAISWVQTVSKQANTAQAAHTHTHTHGYRMWAQAFLTSLFLFLSRHHPPAAERIPDLTLSVWHLLIQFWLQVGAWARRGERCMRNTGMEKGGMAGRWHVNTLFNSTASTQRPSRRSPLIVFGCVCVYVCLCICVFA